MISADYIKQLEAANQLLQQKLEDANLKLEESSIREKCLQLRPKRMWTLNGYKDIKTAKEYVTYKNKPYPDNSRYPDYMYWTNYTDCRRKRDSDFYNHFIYQMRLYMGITSNYTTNCRELWLDDKIMEMSILILSWHRVCAVGRVFRQREVDVNEIHNFSICRRYIIERGNPQVYLYRGKARVPGLTPAIRIQP